MTEGFRALHVNPEGEHIFYLGGKSGGLSIAKIWFIQQNLDFISPSWQRLTLRKLERTGREVTYPAVCILESF